MGRHGLWRRGPAGERRGAWWRPDRAAWWMGLLFAVGSLLFGVAAIASFGSSADAVGITFFCGSIFFTSAALVQFLAANARSHRGRPREEREPLHPRAWIPARADWLSAAVQLAGTILFNVNTFEAMQEALTTQQADVRVWVPDMIGSGCFLLSSMVAFANAEHAWLSWRPRDLDWWITGLNLLGSLAFGASALASFVRPATGAAVSEPLDNAGTALGALCFLVAALLLIAEAERRSRRANRAGARPLP